MFTLLKQRRFQARERFEEMLLFHSWKTCFQEKLVQALRGMWHEERGIELQYTQDFWTDFHAKIYPRNPREHLLPLDESRLKEIFDLLEMHSLEILTKILRSSCIDTSMLSCELSGRLEEWECLIKTLITCIVDPEKHNGSSLTTRGERVGDGVEQQPVPFSWREISERLQWSLKAETHLQFFFAKLQWKLVNGLVLASPDPLLRMVSVTNCCSPHTKSQPFKNVGLSCSEISDAIKCIVETRSQMRILDQDTMSLLGACAVERFTPPPGSQTTRTGLKFHKLVEDTLALARPQPPPMLKHHHIDTSLTSTKCVFTEMCSWYGASIRSSLSKWSLKAVITLSVQDICLVLDSISRSVSQSKTAGCGEITELRQSLMVLQEQSVAMCHHRLVTKCSSVLEDTFPTAKQWKAMKKVKTLETSLYVDALLEKVFLPLFDMIANVSEEIQVVLLLWHVSLVCAAYSKKIREYKKCYSKPACDQLKHDFSKLLTWLGDAMGSMVDTKVKEQVLNSLPFHYVQNGLNILAGEDSTHDCSLLPGPAPPPVSSTYFVQCVYQQDILREPEKEFNFENLTEWKMCRR